MGDSNSNLGIWSKEVETMKKFLMALAVLALVSAPAFAGPNVGGVLVVHDTGLAYVPGTTSYPSDAPLCADVDNQIDLGNLEYRVWKVYAAFPVTSTPRLAGVIFGLSYPAFGDGYVVVMGAGLPASGDLEVTQDGWPGSGGSNAVAFPTAKLTQVSEVYWFGGYAYSASGADAQMFSTAPHGTQNSVFLDDAVPANEDPITQFGAIGFGQAGVTICPPIPTGACCSGPNNDCSILSADECLALGGTFLGGECTPDPCEHPPTGACCLADHSCIVTTDADCTVQGGEYVGDGYPCEAGTCEPIIPTLETTWGAIKNNYR